MFTKKLPLYDSLANLRAISWPIPDVAPVTIATRDIWRMDLKIFKMKKILREILFEREWVCQF